MNHNLLEKLGLSYLKCGTKNEVLWFPAYSQTYRIKGTTGGSGTRTDRKGEKVEGQCKGCGYKFKAKDLD